MNYKCKTCLHNIMAHDVFCIQEICNYIPDKNNGNNNRWNCRFI